MVGFSKLSPEKKLAILSGAFSCFGKNGYRKTSVADIAAAVGISKASIFQYFGTKKGLYIYLYQFAIDAITEKAAVGSDDFFECIQRAAEQKLRVFKKYPGMFEFLSSTINEKDPEISATIQDLNTKGLQDGKAVLFSKVNYEKFKSEADFNMLFNIITWVNEGYLRASLRQKDADTMWRELSAYISILKAGFYKEEFLK